MFVVEEKRFVVKNNRGYKLRVDLIPKTIESRLRLDSCPQSFSFGYGPT